MPGYIAGVPMISKCLLLIAQQFNKIQNKTYSEEIHLVNSILK